MLQEKSGFGGADLLKMETYKTINRELTIKNQELRQYGNLLRDELCDARRKLVEERQSRAIFKKSVIAIITDSFNRILHLLYDNDEDRQILSSNVAFEDNTQKENSQSRQETAKSNQHSRKSKEYNFSSPKNSFTEASASVRSPLVHIQNNVTLRNRRAKGFEEEHSGPNNRNMQLDIQENIDGLETAIDFREESSEDLQHSLNALQLPVVIEETSSNMDASSLILRRSRNRIYEIQYSTENTITPDSSESFLQSTQSRNSKNFVNESSDYSGKLCNTVGKSPLKESRQREPMCSLNIPDIPLNESTFNSSSMLKAPSSTPYKAGKVNNDHESNYRIRNVRVVIPRLKPDTLSRFGISLEEPNSPEKESSSKASTSRARKKNVNTSSTIMQSTCLSDASTSYNRPKRKAAEVAKSCLIEPQLNTKMRRKT